MISLTPLEAQILREAHAKTSIPWGRWVRLMLLDRVRAGRKLEDILPPAQTPPDTDPVG